MSQEGRQFGERRGPIAYMASNGVAANLLMVGIVAAGLVSFTGLEQEAWPELPFNQVEVSVAYPGATPEEVEESIVLKIEEQVSAIDDVKTVRSLAAQGMASVRVEMSSGADLDDALDDIESAVNSIQTLPASAERPEFREMTNRQSIMRLIVYGDVPERSLKELAYQIEDELATVLASSRVETTGVRNYEISIEVPKHRLRALGLTLQDISNVIRAGAVTLSSGSIDTQEAEVRVRTVGQPYDQKDFQDMVVLARGDGTIVRLGDIAEVRDDFEQSALVVRHQGQPAAFIEISRAQGEDVADVVATVKEHVEDTLSPSLPDGVRITVWNDDSELFAERLSLLITNGGLGFLLVLVALTLFLELRLAIWVAVGLVVSGVGAVSVLLVLDLPINSFSLFAFILAIGIVVDDAIVVAEHIHHERSLGTPGLPAAIRGTRRIKGPLIFAVLTSVAAFTPLLFLPGGIGEIMGPMPVVVISMLLFSLVESLLVLRARGSRLALDALPGARPEGKGDLAPRVEIRRRARQMQDEAADGADDVDAELEQPIAQPHHLGSGTRGARRVQPQFLHEHVGCGGQKNAQLVRPESAAARAVELQVLEFLDPVLDVATGAVDLLVEKTRRLPHVRHHEARVVPRLAVPETDDFGLDDDPARGAPRARRIVGVHVEMLGLLAALATRPRHQHRRLGVPQQHGVARHRHHVVEPRLCTQEVEQRRGRKAAVEPNQKARPWKRAAQQRQQPCQQGHAPFGGDRLAVPQHRRTQILLGFAVERQEREQRQVTPVVIVPIEEAVLLGAVRRVVGRVQIDRDAPNPPQPAAVALDNTRRQLAPHVVERAAAGCVLEPRQRRLRGQ